MSTPTLRRRVTATALASAAVLALGACGTSFSAQTNQQYQAAEGANVRGDVDAMNTVLVADESGTAVVSAGLVNKTDAEQTLTGVTINAGGQQLKVEPPASEIVIAPGRIVTLGSTADNAFKVLSNAKAGAYVTFTFTFSDAKDTVVEAPTVARSATYESVVPAN